MLQLDIYGSDYPTPDGTCIRDYIHIEDLAGVRVPAPEYLLDGGSDEILNCIYGPVSSVRDVVQKKARMVADKILPFRKEGRQSGGPPELAAESSSG